MLWSKPLNVCWLVAVVVVASLTLWHLPAWRSLCREPGTATGQVIGIHLDHGRVRYRFQAGGRTWTGTTDSYSHNGSWLDLYASVEVYYAPPDPSINQAGRPAAGDWWQHAARFFLIYGLFLPTMIVGMIRQFLKWVEERTALD